MSQPATKSPHAATATAQAATPAHAPPHANGAPARPRPQALRSGYLHIGPDWRITYAHLEGGRSATAAGQGLVGQVLWDLYPAIVGTPFEEAYRATMADR